MPSPVMIRRATLVGTDVSNEDFASIIIVIRIGEIVFLCSLLRLLVTTGADSSHPDDGGVTFSRNSDSYKSHKV
jgi:hypothetical protein